ncbi:Scr1 family TA system antitoxin-like transcriptional regulator [Streptomyces sp. MBT53]|uniref:Scr1 family TA system antitoxin-like transcriptional regulator n=1 Tax=Streptomyces sp. MBT53 TaxID=1488384 RepID=UPI0027DA85C9|nr:Scr1 family TA system antitoxin-like transcriptional regulator [Streptomyces sp. MBT53]
MSDRRVARGQLDELLEPSERPGVTVRVIPFDVDGFAGASAALLYAGGRVPVLDTVQKDTVEWASLEPAPSRDFLHRLAKES